MFIFQIIYHISIYVNRFYMFFSRIVFENAPLYDIVLLVAFLVKPLYYLGRQGRHGGFIWNM